MRLYQYLRTILWIGSIVLVAEPAFATQAHSAPEGLYAHQLAHIFFIVFMGVLIFWLRERQLVQATERDGFISNTEVSLTHKDERRIRVLVSGSLDKGFSDKDEKKIKQVLMNLIMNIWAIC